MGDGVSSSKSAPSHGHSGRLVIGPNTSGGPRQGGACCPEACDKSSSVSVVEVAPPITGSRLAGVEGVTGGPISLARSAGDGGGDVRQPTVRRCWSAVPLSPAPSRCPHARRHARGPGCPPVLGRQMVGRRGVPMRPGGGRVGSCFSGGPAVVLPLMVVKVFGTSGASTSSPPSVPFCHRARSRLQEGLFPLLGSGTAWLLHRR